MSEQSIVTELAKQVLNENGQEAVETLILDNKIHLAKIYLLGAIDSLWTKKLISDSEAAEAYKVLNIDPEKSSKVRQESILWK